MNNWLVVALLAGSTCFTSIVFIYCLLYVRYRERALLAWAGAWLAHAARNVAIAIGISGGPSPLLLAGEHCLMAVTALLLLTGAASFSGKSPGRAAYAAVAAITAWAALAAVLDVPEPWLHVPAYVFFAGALVACGRALLAGCPQGGIGRPIAGWAFILWGLHQLDLPFLRPMYGPAFWGFLAGATLGLLAAIAVILAYFERLKAKLGESEGRFRALFHDHDAILLLIEPESGAILDANASALEFYGYAREELLGMPISRINTLPPSEVDALRRQAKEKRVRYFIFPHSLKNGEMRTVEVYSSPVQVEGRTLLFSIIHDITDRKKAEKALQENRERYRAVVEAADTGIVLLDPQGTILSLNGFARRILGGEKVREGGKLALSELCVREDATPLPAGEDPAARTLATGEPVRDALMGVPAGPGFVWISVNTAPVLAGEDDKPGGVAVTFADVTQARRAARMLAELNRTLTTVLESVPAGVNVVRIEDCEILFMNKAAMTTFNRDCTGGKCHMSFRERQAPCEDCTMPGLFMSGVEPEQENVREEFNPVIGRWLLHHERAVRWIDGSIARVQTSVDITERRRDVERLAASLKEKEVLLREIHHRVKNNLQVVSSLLYLQQQECRDPEGIRALEESRNRVSSMAHIHEQLYRTSELDRIDAGEFLERFLPKLAASVAGNLAIRVEVEADPVPLPVERAIPFGLLVNELATNAFKHAFPGRGTGTVRVALAAEGGHAVLTVSDDGKGLPEDFSLDSSQTLGMQLVGSLAAQLRGVVGANSGAGAEFTLRIPL